MAAMSADMDRDQFRAALLAAAGGEPCVDLDRNNERQGVWLPESAWHAVADTVYFVAKLNDINMSEALTH
jgi:hypothetical protein